MISIEMGIAGGLTRARRGNASVYTGMVLHTYGIATWFYVPVVGVRKDALRCRGTR